MAIISQMVVLIFARISLLFLDFVWEIFGVFALDISP